MVDLPSRDHSEGKRFQIFCDGKKLRSGAKSRIANRHKVTRKTVSRNDVLEPQQAWANLRSKKKGVVGRKKIDTPKVISKLKLMPLLEIY